ncbi:hypothetical protein F5887DRAFT_1190097 [Amanita rubescens]|nr:hypothetical protein F5887DRAFT_1190097 [Amanita rubescens]
MTTTREWEKNPWLAQLDWTLKKAGKSRGVEPDEPKPEPEPEHDVLQVPEDPAWLSTLVTSPSRIISLLLKLAYNRRRLKLRRRQRKLRTARGQKTLGPRHAKLLLASGEMTSDDNDLAIALSSGSKDLDDRIQELAARVMDEARKDPESAVVQDPWFSQLDWSPKKKTKRKDQEKPKAPAVYDRSHPTKPNAPLLFKLAWRGLPFVSFERARDTVGYTAFPLSVSETSKHGSSLTFSNPANSTFVDLVLHHGSAFHKLPHKNGEKGKVGSPLGKTPGGEAKEALELNAVRSYWMSSRDRIMNQMVVWEGGGRKLGFKDKDDKWGIILPQVITMGTVTCGAIEKNRVGSELKAMVRAPPGYAIIGADVDSEELWILSCMGDAQFGQRRDVDTRNASTKGRNTHRSDMLFDRKFWFGGSESFVFKLEDIANSEKPRTPALGCGIVSMKYLIKRYHIQARYLIPVHDELRYLVKEEDEYRATLALQISNLWTRGMFAYMLGMDDLPQGVAFFSAVDVDKYLGKEVDMECVTPSQPAPIPPGEFLNIESVLEKTAGSLGEEHGIEHAGSLEGYEEPDCMVHRANTAAFLKAQAAQDFGEVKGLAQKVHGVKFEGGIGGRPGVNGKKGRKGKGGENVPLGNGEGIDWSEYEFQRNLLDEYHY